MTRFGPGTWVAVVMLATASGQDTGSAGRAGQIARELEAADDAKDIERHATALHTLYAAPGTAPELRETVRLQAVAALRGGRDRRLKATDARLAASEGVAGLKELKTEINRRREAALKAIAEAKTYLPENHPDFPKGDLMNGQAAVESLILLKHPGSLQELWNAPAAAAVDPALRADAQGAVESASKLLALFGETEREPRGFETLFHHLAQEKLDLRSLALDAREAEFIAWNRKVDRYNDGIADSDVGAPEREHAAVINDYREMLGRRRLFLDTRLCRSSKKHSAACNAAQKIWHAGVDGDPQTRAKLEAFPNAVGENVAIAFAHPADLWWRGWFRASDHHRNALIEKWTCLGYGYVGNVGTQTFSDILPPKALR